MKVSLNWLRRYVDIAVPLEELCNKMVLSGFEVDGLEDLSATMSNVVVGRILKLEKHPDADKLLICQIDVGGEEPVQIVTGAQNVFEGALVPAALHDSHLPCGSHIKKGKLRGVASNGMLCSGEELCLKNSDYPGAEEHGILILQQDFPLGTDMREVLGLNDIIIDFSITANRPDCQSVLGIAREVAVALKTEMHKPVPSYKTAGDDIRGYIQVSVEDTDLCPRYYGRVVKNLRIQPSPDWMKQCLKAAGMRPINNIVDITNFVMLETGQPMHAFDMRDVRGSQIIVRRAKDGEPMTTLDGKEHTLSEDMLVIADAEQPSCLAGVMGSLDSEIKDDTSVLFFESAKFRRDSVRHTARALGIRTESSARFEKGVDILNVEYAMERALQLIDELDAGDIVDGVIDCHEGLPNDRILKVSVASVCALLGVEIPGDAMVDILNRLGIRTSIEGDTLTCAVPSYRDDIEGRADIAEEVMRVYGYNHIVGTPLRGEVTRGRKLHDRICNDRIKVRLIADGMHEISTYSFISSKATDTLHLSEEDARRRTAVLLNPLSEEYSTMRSQMITSMLTVLATNYNRKITDVRFFEVGKCFVPHTLPVTEQPMEAPVLSLGLYGGKEDFFTLKGIVEDVFAIFGLNPDYTRSAEPYLHPGRLATAVVDGQNAAVFGEVHPDVAEHYGIDSRVYVAEIPLSLLYAVEPATVQYQALPRYPSVERDLALLCHESMPVAEIEKAIRASGGKYLESVALFDVYQGAQITAGQKSVAYRLVFRSPQTTLTEQDLEPVLKKIFNTLNKKGCTLRS